MGLSIREIIPKKEIELDNLKGKTLCVDAFNTLYQFLSTIRQPDGTPLMDNKKRITSHLSGLFYRNINLLSEGIKLIYVFDGEAPELKARTHKKRKDGRDLAKERYSKAKQKEDFVEMKTFSLQNTVVTRSSPRWQPASLPPGFKLTSHSHKTGAEGIYEHMVYSDGLAAVSVYVEKQGMEAEVKPGISQLGTHNAYTRKQGELQITVIGEVPAITVKTIANEMALSVAVN